MGESAIPLINQVMTLTMTQLKLMTAEIGPVGPSLRANMTNSSARVNNAPVYEPMRRVSFSMYRLSGIGIYPKADKIDTISPQRKSASRLSFKKVKGEMILLQNLAVFILLPSMSMQAKASMIIDRIAFLYCSLT